MSKVISNAIGKEFIEALGLEGLGVRSLSVNLRKDELVSVDVWMDAVGLPNGVEGLKKAAKILKRYELIESDQEPSDES